MSTPIINAVSFQIRLESAPYADLLPGGEERTTCWQDFLIANHWGPSAVKDTYRRIFDEFKQDIRYLIELSFSLNYMSWRLHAIYEEGHRTLDGQLCELYSHLWEKVNDYVYESGECSRDQIDAFFSATD